MFRKLKWKLVRFNMALLSLVFIAIFAVTAVLMIAANEQQTQMTLNAALHMRDDGGHQPRRSWGPSVSFWMSSKRSPHSARPGRIRRAGPTGHGNGAGTGAGTRKLLARYLPFFLRIRSGTRPFGTSGPDGVHCHAAEHPFDPVWRYYFKPALAVWVEHALCHPHGAPGQRGV